MKHPTKMRFHFLPSGLSVNACVEVLFKDGSEFLDSKYDFLFYRPVWTEEDMVYKMKTAVLEVYGSVPVDFELVTYDNLEDFNACVLGVNCAN